MTTKNIFSISIIVCAVIIAGGVFLINQKNNLLPKEQDNNLQEKIQIKPISEDDHILGNPSAPILFIEYADFECPFCKEFQVTMNKIMQDYGKTGKVAWVYRHFPLVDFHANAMDAALASECVASLGDNNKFWEFANLTYDQMPDSLTKDALKENAISLGIPEQDYLTCIASTETRAAVNSDIEDGKALANNDDNFGTPYTIAITPNEIVPLVGSQPYRLFKEIIENY